MSDTIISVSLFTENVSKAPVALSRSPCFKKASQYLERWFMRSVNSLALLFNRALPNQSKISCLVIHKMVLINFKSYAGGRRLDHFTGMLTSILLLPKNFDFTFLFTVFPIIGPNGSGKSNMINVLLFIFGYCMSKMRQGKLSELIHNSAWCPDLDDSSIEVHFCKIIDLVRVGMMLSQFNLMTTL
jgi:hypothetical protein